MASLRWRDTARAMLEEKVEVAWAVFAAWNAGNMDALREL
jgi:DNA/RNA-binding domain of Phe-tRNA-synthetase-like protein